MHAKKKITDMLLLLLLTLKSAKMSFRIKLHGPSRQALEKESTQLEAQCPDYRLSKFPIILLECLITRMLIVIIT